MMKRLFQLLFLCSFLIQCAPNEEIKYNKIELIPQPMSQTFDHATGSFKLELNNTEFLANKLDKEVMAKWLEQANFTNKVGGKVLEFILDEKMSLGEHSLEIKGNGIEIKGQSEEALYHGFQSLRQIVDVHEGSIIELPFGKLKDKPRFPYRGMHLDVARHFFDVDAVKKYIDMLAYHKMNKFHWHLTEDQGWRIEIKKYPKLQEIAAFRNETLIGHYNDQPHQFDGKKYGGFYTQDEVREIVKYAAERYVEVIPEIEMPGHAQAALTAYPELGCTGGPYEVLTIWGISENVFCPTEKTFAFLEDVLTEVMALFPSKYLHIGGDECPKTTWKESSFCQKMIKDLKLKDEHGLQSYFIQRIEKFVNKNGKKIIGWDEILEGGLAPNATVMSWRGEEGGIEAANEGHDVIMTPTSHCYFDYYQSEDADEPLAIGGFLPLERVYGYEPIPDKIKDDKRHHILGAQGNLWTEYMPSQDHMEYMAFPRICAMAEIGWTSLENKDYKSFVARLRTHYKRLDKYGVNYANHLDELKMKALVDTIGNMVTLDCANPDAEIKYAVNGGKSWQAYDAPFEMKGEELKYEAWIGETKLSKTYEKKFTSHKAVGSYVKAILDPSEKFGTLGAGILTNGIEADGQKFGDREWLGYDEYDASLIIDLGEPKEFTSVEIELFNAPAYWIYLPSKIQAYFKMDDKGWVRYHRGVTVDGPIKKSSYEITSKARTAQFIKLEIENYGTIPEGAEGAGNRPWMFIGEIKVK